MPETSPTWIQTGYSCVHALSFLDKPSRQSGNYSGFHLPIYYHSEHTALHKKMRPLPQQENDCHTSAIYLLLSDEQDRENSGPSILLHLYRSPYALLPISLFSSYFVYLNFFNELRL